MNQDNAIITEYVTDTITGRPHGFTVTVGGGKKRRRFFLWPVTLGKMHLLQPLVEALGIDPEKLQSNCMLEFLRVAESERDVCLSILAYHTCRGSEEVFNTKFVENRRKVLREALSVEDIASLLVIVLSSDRLAQIMKHFGIDKENDMLSRVSKAKDSKNSLVFGGKSPFGNLIDAACERYGWTKEYVVWGIDYVSLRLMLADKVTSVYVTDDELRKLPASIRSKDDATILPTRENMEVIKSMDWR